MRMNRKDFRCRPKADVSGTICCAVLAKKNWRYTALVKSAKVIG